jgi:hypothetical protein
MSRQTDAPRNPVFEPWVMNVPRKLVCYEGGFPRYLRIYFPHLKVLEPP